MSSISTQIDRIALHRLLGIPIFFTLLYSLFYLALGLGHQLQNLFDTRSRALFIEGLTHLLDTWHSPEWLVALLANGVGGGMNTLITFIPVLSILFLCLSFLEYSGYMARAAFIMDKITRRIGLPGKSFIPIILGFACNVPAVMAARSLESRRDQILTVMMTPFMSCTARLAIYAVFAAVFFPHFAAPAIFCLYLFGVSIALLTGLLLRKTVLKGHATPFVMRLPDYHWPSLRSILGQTWQRLWGFLWRAGTLILPMCVCMGALNAVDINGHGSILSILGRSLTPLFSPLGIHPSNWPATVGLLTGVLAKEVVIGSLNTLYQPGQMLQQFDGAIGAFTYLIFVLLYFPCISTIAVVARELGKKWACFSVAWSTLSAYSLAMVFYQTATLTRHPLSSLLYIGLGLGLISAVIFLIYYVAERGKHIDWVGTARGQGFNKASACGNCQGCKVA